MDCFVFLCLELCLDRSFSSACDCIKLSDGVPTALTTVRVSRRVKDAVERIFTKVAVFEHDDVDRSALVVGRADNVNRSALFARVRLELGFHNLVDHTLKCVS